MKSKSQAAATQLFGFLNINKPPGMTAHDVVNQVRKILGTKQVGHAGTLDPMAIGVLPLAVGKATRLFRFLNSDKTYVAGIMLGVRTTTDDITGEVLWRSSQLPEHHLVHNALLSFQGEQRQKPPLYSAVHVGGKRLYSLARRGEAPDTIPERTVTIYSIQPLGFGAPPTDSPAFTAPGFVVKARIRCSSGTYIRSIARDLGEQLGCGACLSDLIREQAGPFSLKDSVCLDELEPRQCLIDPIAMLDIPKVEVDRQQVERLANGIAIVCQVPASSTIMAVHDGNLIAICRGTAESDPAFVRMQPEVVLLNAAKHED